MIETPVSSRIALEAYGPDTWPDQVAFSPPSGTVGDTSSRGVCSPSLTVYYSSEQGPFEIIVGLRMVFFNGVSPDGLDLAIDVPGLRIVDPATMYAGPLSGHPWYTSPGLITIRIDWGDASPEDVVEMEAGGVDPLPSHVYAEAGLYPLRVTAVFTDPNYTAVGGSPNVVLDVAVVEP